MSKKVTVVDYGIGNLFSVARALESNGAQVEISSDPQTILNADRLVLPGVGAFAKGMLGLRERGLVGPLLAYAEKDRPLLGICLGMQLLFQVSSEFGRHEGLGLIDGEICAIEPSDETGRLMKVPHIGWSPLVRPPACHGWQDTILRKLRPGAHAYFVHSYSAQPAREEDRLADAYYGNARISAVVRKGHISGCQFHPEKSSVQGLRIIESFLEI